MDKIAVANELMVVAKLLSGAVHGFTKMVPLKLKPEGGTRISLENAQMIKDAGYDFSHATAMFNNEKADYKLHAWFSRSGDMPQEWVFKGFSAGYGGEGPRGLLEFGQIFGIPLKQSLITSHDAMAETGLLDGRPFDLNELT